MPDHDVRLQQLTAWLAGQLENLFRTNAWGEVPAGSLTAASSDASFRRYFRWEGAGHSFVIMDAPPPQENCCPFVDIDHLLATASVNVPVIHAQDLERGFLLLGDLGRQTYLDIIDQGNADALFADAIDALLAFQRLPMDAPLPSYDVALLRREVELFPEWYVGPAQPDAQCAKSRRAGFPGCGLWPGHLRHHLPVQGRFPQLAPGPRRGLVA